MRTCQHNILANFTFLINQLILRVNIFYLISLSTLNRISDLNGAIKILTKDRSTIIFN